MQFFSTCVEFQNFWVEYHVRVDLEMWGMPAVKAHDFIFVGKFRHRLIELISFKLKLLIKFIMIKSC